MRARKNQSVKQNESEEIQNEKQNESEENSERETETGRRKFRMNDKILGKIFNHSV